MVEGQGKAIGGLEKQRGLEERDQEMLLLHLERRQNSSPSFSIFWISGLERQSSGFNMSVEWKLTLLPVPAHLQFYMSLLSTYPQCALLFCEQVWLLLLGLQLVTLWARDLLPRGWSFGGSPRWLFGGEPRVELYARNSLLWKHLLLQFRTEGEKCHGVGSSMAMLTWCHNKEGCLWIQDLPEEEAGLT